MLGGFEVLAGGCTCPLLLADLLAARARKSGEKTGRSGCSVVALVSNVTSIPCGKLEKYFCLCNDASAKKYSRVPRYAHLLSWRSISRHEIHHLSLRHRHYSLALTLPAKPLLINLVDHALVNRRMVAIPMIRRIATITEDYGIACRAGAAQTHFTYRRLWIAAIGRLFLGSSGW